MVFFRMYNMLSFVIMELRCCRKMKCRRCNEEVPDGVQFCPYCGANLAMMNRTEMENERLRTEENNRRSVSREFSSHEQERFDEILRSRQKKSSGSKKLVPVIIAAVVILCGGIGGFVLMRPSGNDDKETSQNVSSVSESSAAPAENNDYIAALDDEIANSLSGNKYRDAIAAVDKTASEHSENSDFVAECNAKKCDIYTKWVAYAESQGNYFGSDGAVAAASELDGLSGNADVEGCIARGVEYEKANYITIINAKRAELGYSPLEEVPAVSGIAASNVKKLIDSGADSASYDITEELNTAFPKWMEWKTSSSAGTDGAQSFADSLDKSDETGEFNSSFGYIGVGAEYNKKNKSIAWYVITISDK